MNARRVFELDDYRIGTADLRLCADLRARYADERPFAGLRAALGHPLVWNSLILADAIVSGGGEIVIAHPFRSRSTQPVEAALLACATPILTVDAAAASADAYIDVNAVLGRARTPMFATEITRTGVEYYRDIPCRMLSADDTRAKRIEASLGMGDSFVRAFEAFQGCGRLRGLRIVQFGFGKIGRGVAIAARRAGAQATIVDIDADALADARALGYATIPGNDSAAVREVLRGCGAVVAVTGIGGAVGRSVPVHELLAADPVLVNMGADDEFGPDIPTERVLGGKGVPPNFHLDTPTLNRYIDPSLAAQLLAIEWFVKHGATIPTGVSPLPSQLDDELVQQWSEYWPDEDHTAFADNRKSHIGLEASALVDTANRATAVA
jgi:adenosylhomocysteinase